MSYRIIFKRILMNNCQLSICRQSLALLGIILNLDLKQLKQ